MGVLETQWLITIVGARKEDDRAYKMNRVRWIQADRELHSRGIPGTSSVSGSLNMPRFHLRRGASLSCVATAVEVAPFSSTSCVLRQGVKLTMAGQDAQGGAKGVYRARRRRRTKKK